VTTMVVDMEVTVDMEDMVDMDMVDTDPQLPVMGVEVVTDTTHTNHILFRDLVIVPFTGF